MKITADNCDEIANALKVFDKYYRSSQKHDKKACKNKSNEVIKFVKSNGLASKEELKNIINSMKNNKVQNKTISYWTEIGISDISEIKKWQELNFKMSNSMLRRYDGSSLKKLKKVGLTATEFKEWTTLHNLKINNPHSKVDYNDRNNIPTIIEWSQSGITLSQAKEWSNVNIKINDISKWKNVGIKTSTKAKYLIDNSITINDVKEAKQNNIMIKEVIEWKNLKIISSVSKILNIKKSGYNTPNEFKKVCSKVITNTNFMYDKKTKYNDYCFNGSFKVSEVKSNNKVKVLVPVIGINKSKKDLDLKVENTIIEANNKLNKDFKNSKSKFIGGVFKIRNGTFSKYLERISY